MKGQRVRSRGNDIVYITDKYIPQYVRLRNKYLKELMTNPITEEGTRSWKGGRILCSVKKNVLKGAVILYNNGQLAVFVKEPNKGIGTELLKGIKGWACIRTDNHISQHLFRKSGFKFVKKSVRKYKGEDVSVKLFSKYAKGDKMTDQRMLELEKELTSRKSMSHKRT